MYINIYMYIKREREIQVKGPRIRRCAAGCGRVAGGWANSGGRPAACAGCMACRRLVKTKKNIYVYTQDRNDLEPIWSNNYTQATRAVALEIGPHHRPGVSPPTNNTNCIEFTMDNIVFAMN